MKTERSKRVFARPRRSVQGGGSHPSDGFPRPHSIMEDELEEIVRIIRAEARAFLRKHARYLLLSEDDLAQEVVVHFLRNDKYAWNQFDESRGSRANYVRQVTRSRAFEILRKQRRRDDSRLEAHIEQGGSGVPPAPKTPEEIVSRAEFCRCVLECFEEALTREEMIALELRLLQDLTYAEIARHLDWPLHKVNNRISNARQKADRCGAQCERDEAPANDPPPQLGGLHVATPRSKKR